MQKIMVISLFYLSLILPAACLHAAVPGNQGQGLEAGFQGDQNTERQTAVSRRRASDLARARYQGRILSIRLDGSRWRVRMDSEGTVFNVFVNARTGEVTR